MLSGLGNLEDFDILAFTHRNPFFRTVTMVVVAIAGGTGGVGRTLLDAIVEAGEHEAITLSRTVSSLTLSL